MFKNAYQSGLLSVFYSCGSDPLAIWNMEVKNGHVKRVMDPEINSIVLEIISTNVATTYITCPKSSKQCLGIKLPFLVMIVKNLKRYFSFEITVIDDTNMRRRFRISNFQSTTKIRPFCTTMPIGLSGGWNQIQFNLSDFTRRAYGTQFIETLRVQIHANVRLRRIYFADRLYTEEELPQEYKLYLPLDSKRKKVVEKKDSKTKVAGAEAAAALPPPAEGQAAAAPAPEPEPAPAPAPAPSKEAIPAAAAPAEAPAEAAAPAEGEQAAEGGAAPEGAPDAEGEAPAEGAAAEGEAPAAAEGEAPAEGAAPAEGEAPPAEGAAPTEEAPAEAPADAAAEAPAEGEAPAEAPAEEAPPAE